ncbi:MAG TPA: bifunctional ornithine acetyltransferase/N-acetylglutamate synthase [Candidatus Bathyarchaeia archaeon]|nr:bifunctional ornithine acetyltransferase/N-acetylglutamate synthase [Candidatus Bathyarchaeia archaeon]
MRVVEGGVCAVRGVKASGYKAGKNGIAVITGGGQAAGVFTTNKVAAAPVDVTRRHLSESHQILAVVANSGSANAFTGPKGVTDAEAVAKLLARRMQIRTTDVAVASTGVIGVPLNVGWIHSKMDEVLSATTDASEGSLEAARAIMTTDSAPKQIAVEIEGVSIGGVAKGAGMIEPQLATMLAFIYTDAQLTADILQTCLKKATDVSFNMVVVDGDTSTNDTVLLIATGASPSSVGIGDFQNALNFVCIELAKMIARDGEGATKMMEVAVAGARTHEDAIKAAKAVARSSLVKTALFGADPNWGRIIAAIGYSGAAVDPTELSLAMSDGIGTVPLVQKGVIRSLSTDNLAALSQIMKSAEISILVDLGMGDASATAWGCDLTEDYVRVNAEHTT